LLAVKLRPYIEKLTDIDTSGGQLFVVVLAVVSHEDNFRIDECLDKTGGCFIDEESEAKM
jgi:hypothetical protein